MIEIGKTNSLIIERQSTPGIYLADNQGNEVLLPNRYIPTTQTEGWAMGETIDVFVYPDSEDRLVATTETPKLEVGGIAALKVVSVARAGAFVDWGLSKDLLVPFANQYTPLSQGEVAMVAAYLDNASQRVVGSTRIGRRYSNEVVTVSRGEMVDIVVAQRKERGYRVIVNDKHWGMLYDSQLFRNVQIGDKFQAWVTKITDDCRIDVSLQMEGFDQVKIAADAILLLLNHSDGRLALGDEVSPQEIQLATGMSKKVFKRVVGYLLKAGVVETDRKSVWLKKN